MKFEDLLKRVWFFDFEVYAHDWLLVLESRETYERVVFHNTPRQEILDFIEQTNPILVGHNAKYYDQYILKGILAGFDNEQIKETNDYIIKGNQGWQVNYGNERIKLPPVWDTIQDVVPMKGLKEIEGNLRMNIVECTIPFDLPTKWTKEQYEEILGYCIHDVQALRPLFEAREKENYFRTKFDLCMLSNLDPEYNIGNTNAKLVAKYLGAERKEHNDEREYVIPELIDQSLIPTDILDFFGKITDYNIDRDTLFGSKKKKIKPMNLVIDLYGADCKYAWGGQHGALKKYFGESNDKRVIINCDFESLYPHLLALEKYGYISRNIPNARIYSDTLKKRLVLKKEGKKAEQVPLKLILNTAYGCQNNQYNDLYDPKGARATCITGQLLLTELIVRIMTIPDSKLIQSNTDGIMVELPISELDNYYKICGAFVDKCGINLEYDIIKKIYQKDVNGYCMLDSNNKLKVKGGYFSASPDIKIKVEDNEDENHTETLDLKTMYSDNFKANSLSIVAEAVLKHLMFDIDITETIMSCDDIFRFQMISKVGGSYDRFVQESPGGDIILQKTNRIYAGFNKSGCLVKVKNDGRRDSLASCPTNPIIDNDNHCDIKDINKQWYIDLANQRVSDFLGLGKKIMEGRKKLMKKDELLEEVKRLQAELDAAKNQVPDKKERNEETVMDKNTNIQVRLNNLRKEMRTREFIYDKELPKNLGGAEFYSIDQMYDAIQELSLSNGLGFKFEAIERLSFEKNISTPANAAPRHLVTVKARATFVNIDNPSEIETYDIMGSGSDTMDKCETSALTTCFRSFVKYNFTPRHTTEDIDLVTDTEVSVETTKTKVYVPEVKKEELVKQAVAKPQEQSSSDDDSVKSIVENIMKIRDLIQDNTYGEATLQRIIKKELTSSDILSVKLKIQNKLDGLAE